MLLLLYYCGHYCWCYGSIVDIIVGVTVLLWTLLILLLYYCGFYCWCYCSIVDITTGVTVLLWTLLLVLLYYYWHDCKHACLITKFYITLPLMLLYCQEHWLLNLPCYHRCYCWCYCIIWKVSLTTILVRSVRLAVPYVRKSV